MTVEEALLRLRPVLFDGATHPDYTRTVDYAAECRMLATGLIGPLLRQNTAETSDEHARRLVLTASISGSIWNGLVQPFYTVARLRDGQVTRRFDYEEGTSPAEADRARQALTEAVSGYYDRRPLEDYLAERVVKTVGMSDPNAWLLTEFGPFDFRTGRAQPYPVLLPCAAVVDFTRQAGVVSSLTVRSAVSKAGATGLRYTCYLDNVAVDCWPVVEAGGTLMRLLPDGLTPAGTLHQNEDGTGTAFDYVLLEHHAGRVPACPVGYVLDQQTEGRTFVSPLDPAIPFLKNELKAGSELGIVMSQMAFPHKLQYVSACPGGMNANGSRYSCVGGLRSDTQAVCSTCEGTGARVQTSAAQVLTFPLPKDPADVKVKLNEMLAFIGPDPAIAKLQLDYQDRLIAKCREFVFNDTDAAKQQVTNATTATERMLANDRENKALTPFADSFSRLYVYHGHVNAAYVDADAGLSIVYDFPADLLLLGKADLYELLKLAADAGVASFELEQINYQIARHTFADDPEALRRYFIKTKFIPFMGLSNTFVLQLATLGYITAEERVLRTHADSIFSELEDEEPQFYNLARPAQQKLVSDKAAAIVGKLGAAAPAGGGVFRALNFNTNQPAPGASASV